jgi:heat shock protein HslJ
MACEGRMELEQSFFAMFPRVSGWKVTGETLELKDADGKTLAKFVAVYLP